MTARGAKRRHELNSLFHRIIASSDLDRVAYAAQALCLIFYVLSLWLEVYIDTKKAWKDRGDPIRESHRYWRLRSSLIFLTWTILGGFAIPFGFGLPVVAMAYLWYALRVLKGWIYWKHGRIIGKRQNAAVVG